MDEISTKIHTMKKWFIFKLLLVVFGGDFFTFNS